MGVETIRGKREEIGEESEEWEVMTGEGEWEGWSRRWRWSTKMWNRRGVVVVRH